MFRSRSSRSGSSSKLTKPSSPSRSEEHTSELQSQSNLVCRLLLEKKKRILHTGSVDPNFGRRVRNCRKLYSVQNTWPMVTVCPLPFATRSTYFHVLVGCGLFMLKVSRLKLPVIWLLVSMWLNTLTKSQIWTLLLKFYFFFN